MNRIAKVELIRKKYLSRNDAADFVEKDHPRDKGGKFTSKSGDNSGGSKNKNEPDKNRSAVAGAPKLKKGARYSDAINVARHTFEKDAENKMVDPGAWDRAMKEITEDDIVYQKDGDEVIASIPGFAAMVDNQVKGSGRMKKIYEDAVSDGKTITRDMLSAASGAGMYLDGVENSVKGASHIEDKAQRKLDHFKEETGRADATVDDVALNFFDVVRYTAITSNDNIVNGVSELRKSLEKNGYKVIEVDNKFLDRNGEENLDATYRAVHLTVQSPNGRMFECQIHSKESMDVKNKNHVMYERQREIEKTPRSKMSESEKAEVQELIDKQVDNWRKYKNPAGIKTLVSYDNVPKGKKFFDKG